MFDLETEIKESNLNNNKHYLPDLDIGPINLRLLLSGDIGDEIKLEKKQLKFTNILTEDITGKIDGEKKN